MGRDAHGLDMSGSAAAIEHYDRAVHELLFFRDQVVADGRAAAAADPGAPMPQVLLTYLGLLGTEVADAATARALFTQYRAGAVESALNPRERAHLAAVETWLAGDMHGAGRTLAALALEYPRDALALFAGHQIDFLTGDAVSLRDRIGGALSAWHSDDEHRGHLLGMYAFGLEEAGHYDRSEPVGLAAVEANPADVWGTHAVAHTYEMQGRFGTGAQFYDERRADWSAGNFLAVHNWWHNALYALEAGDPGRALEIYDASIAPGTAVMELLDAAALLWRFHLEGDPQHERWAALVDAWPEKVAEPYYAFNDVHAVMAYVGADRLADAHRLIADRERWLAAATGPGVGNQRMTAEVGLPVARALLAYGQGRHGEAVDLLYPIRGRVHTFGGSHAQRDAIERTLLESALRAPRPELARALVSERVNIRPTSPFNWLKQAAYHELAGAPAAAAADRAQAAALRP